MNKLLREELLRSIGIYPFIFVILGVWYFSSGQDYPSYWNFLIALAITILTIPLRIWFRRWLHEKN